MLPRGGGSQVALRGRVGVHSGAVMAAIVGHTAPRLLAFGPDVAAAQRLEATGPPGRIHVSSTTAARLSPAVAAAAGGGLEGPLRTEWPAAGSALESFLLPSGAFEGEDAGPALGGGGPACVAGGGGAAVTAFEGAAHEAAGEGMMVVEERFVSTAEDAAAKEEAAAADEMHVAVNGGAGPHAHILAAVAVAAAVQAVAAVVERLRWLHLADAAEALDTDHCTSAAAEVETLRLFSPA